MKLGNFYGLTAPNIIIFMDQMGEDDFIEAVSLLNNPVDKNFILQAKQELGFFRKALDEIPATYEAETNLSFLAQYPNAVIKNGVIEGAESNPIMLEQVKRVMAAKIASYVCQVNRRVMLDTSLYKDNYSVENVRKVFYEIILNFMQDNDVKFSEIDLCVNKIARKLLDRKGSQIMTDEKRVLFQTIVQAFQLKEVLLDNFSVGTTEIFLNEDDKKIITWFKKHRGTLDACLPYMTEKVVASNTQVFSMSFRDLVFRRPERLISEVVHFYKSANATVGREKIIKNIKTNVIEQVELFEKLFKENVLRKGTIEEEKTFIVTIEEDDRKTLKALKRAVKNYDLRLDNCDEEKFQTIVKLFEFSMRLTKEFYNELFGVELTLEEWNATIEKLNVLGVAGLNFYSTHLFMRSLKLFSFDDKIKIEKTAEEIEDYNNVLSEIHAFLDSQLPVGVEIGGAQ